MALKSYLHTPENSQLMVRIYNDFTYHAPKEDQAERYILFREQAHELAKKFVTHCPSSRELSNALTKIDEAVMHANAAIARHES